MSVNIDGMFLVAQAVGVQMQKQGAGGSIIQTSSIYGLVSSDKRIYEGSFYLGRQIKQSSRLFHLEGSCCWLDPRPLRELGAIPAIRVNALVPAGVESGQNDTFKARYSARVPLGRIAKANGNGWRSHISCFRCLKLCHGPLPGCGWRT